MNWSAVQEIIINCVPKWEMGVEGAIFFAVSYNRYVTSFVRPVGDRRLHLFKRVLHTVQQLGKTVQKDCEHYTRLCCAKVHTEVEVCYEHLVRHL